MADDWGDCGFTEDELRATEAGASLIMAQREHFADDGRRSSVIGV